MGSASFSTQTALGLYALRYLNTPTQPLLTEQVKQKLQTMEFFHWSHYKILTLALHQFMPKNWTSHSFPLWSSKSFVLPQHKDRIPCTISNSNNILLRTSVSRTQLLNKWPRERNKGSNEKKSVRMTKALLTWGFQVCLKHEILMSGIK